jgi:hypothetical protein
MFPYDAQLAQTVQSAPASIADVLGTMRAIDSLCVDTDGLKWFNRLYLSVTEAVAGRIGTGGFHDLNWLAVLDVHFAALYFEALSACLAGGPCPGSWSVMFAARDQTRLARIQFALAGMNAHINHDLPYAIVSTCKATQTTPSHGSPHYKDYTSVNSTLDGLIDAAKQELDVRLPGDPMPEVSHLEDLIAAWNVAAFREGAWVNAENIWRDPAPAVVLLEETMEAVTTFAGQALLIPVP